MGDNRETVAQAMYGKSEDDLEIEEQRELKRLMKGEAGSEGESAREHDGAVRRDDTSTQDAATHKHSSHSAVHEAPLHQQLSAAGAQEADDTGKNYPTQSDQKVTTQAESDKKAT